MNYILILVAVIIIFFMLKNKKSGGIIEGKYKYPSEIESEMKKMGLQIYMVVSNNTIIAEINGVAQTDKKGIISKTNKKVMIDGDEKELYKIVSEASEDGENNTYIANNKSGALLLYAEIPETKELQNVATLIRM
jgi:hypothetical protein